MKKFWLFPLSLLLLFTACKGRTNEAPEAGQPASGAPALQQPFSQEQIQTLRDLSATLLAAVKSGEWDEVKKSLEEKLAENDITTMMGQVLANFKVQALAFSGDAEGAKAYVEEMPDCRLKEMIKKNEEEIFDPVNIELGKVSVLFQASEFEEGNKMLDEILAKDLGKPDKQKALAIKAHYYFATKQAEQCEKVLQEAIDIDPESELAGKLTQQLTMYTTILRSGEEKEEEAIEEELSKKEEEAIKEPAE